MTVHELAGADVLITSILVLFLGAWLTRRIPFLRRYSIPEAVTGGLICSSLVAVLYVFFEREIRFDMRTRDLLLLIFFSTIGLTAKMRLLAEGGKALALLVVVAAVFLVVQDLTGVLLAKLVGAHPAYGLFGGSISFAGGYGTAIAWGKVAEEAGLAQAGAVGVAFATFGLIAGGVIGGPIAERLIASHGLQGGAPQDAEDTLEDEEAGAIVSLTDRLGTLLVLALCVAIGDLMNRLLFSEGVTLPGFLTAMAVGILITNGSDLLKIPLSRPAIDSVGELSLALFLSMSLMSMQLWTLASGALALLLVLFAQMLAMTVFTVFVVFRAMGRNYDASVISAGFVGLGLGATPVGIANMRALTQKYGASPKAFLVVPLVGAFFIDIVNALVIKLFIGLPIIQQTPIPGAG